MRILLLLLAPALLSIDVFGQESRYTLTNWKVEDGLPQSSVRCITQTPDGYLWVGTWNGLARFDGVRFISYHSGNTPALHSSNMLSLFPDSKGTLWIGTDGGGVTRYKNGVFSHPDSAFQLEARRIMDVKEDRDGRLWFATELGFYVLRGDSLLRFNSRHGLMRDYSGQVLPAPDGSIYLGMVDDMARVRLVGDSLEILESFRTGGHQVAMDANGRIVYAVVGQGMYTRSGSEVSLDRRFAGLETHETYVLSDGRIWTASWDRIYVGDARSISTLKKVSGVEIGSAPTIFEDRERNIWLSKAGGGLNRLRPKHVEVYAMETGFADNQTMCGLEDGRGNLYVGTWVQGLQRRKPGASSAFESVRFPVAGPTMKDIKEFSDGTIWVGAWASGAFRIRNGRVSRFFGGIVGPSTSVTSICEGTGGSVWIGTAHEGVVHARGSRSTQWSMSNGLSSNNVTAVSKLRNGEIWVSTAGGGVNRISGTSVTVIDKGSGLSNDFVNATLEDGEGRVWIGTVRGLNLWRPAENDTTGHPGTVTAFGQRHGLPDDAAGQMLEDGEHLWIGSIHGIYRVRKQDLVEVAEGRRTVVQCLSLGREDGMLNEECSGGGNSRAWKTRDGRLWFTTSMGAVTFDPRQVTEERTPPDVIIEEVIVENAARPMSGEIVLQPGETKVEFVYTAINFFAPRKLQFRHILEGLEEEWTDVGDQRSARFTNLSPGTYKFRVTAANRSGFWNEEGVSLTFVVLPPFWATWWFRGGSLLFAIGAIVWSARSFERLKIRKLMEEMERKAALERERLRIARDLHDEVGARLTEIGLMTEAASKKKTKAAREEIVQIGTTARGVIDSFREVVWTVSPQQDSLSSLVDFVQHYATRYLGNASIRVRFDVPIEIPEVAIPSGTRHEIFMVVKEALNNVVKHSRASEVLVSFRFDGETVRLEFEDNGRGIKEGTRKRTSNGLTNMKRRMESIGGSASVAAGEKKGTRVILSFAVGTI